MGKIQRAVTPRVVLDTNVVASALLFSRGNLAWLRENWMGRAILPLASRETVLEVIRVFAYPKFGLELQERENLLGDYLPFCEAIEVRPGGKRAIRCRDPHDEAILLLAEQGNADFVVTGDRDLLSVSNFRVPILKPEELRERLRLMRPGK